MIPTIPYPPTPKGISEEILKPSAAFRREVFKVLAAILLFIVTYIILIAGAMGLAVLCGYAGLALVVAFPRFITLALGIGLVGLGVLVLFFLIKFLFKRNTVDHSGLIEIKEMDQPALFAFIRRLTAETKTPFPKRIFVSADVNASVFYNSSFWSMFFPVRKNLQIGLGLVNIINMSEFKAILAHEFGHFSQRSMKLGSYVYNVNQIIYNLLYDNDGYGRTLERWASISGYFAIFTVITVKIVSGIQWLLRQVYTLINKVHMSLSRQMEFHADTVAAFVTGGDHLTTALRRLEIGESTFNSLFDYYHEWQEDGVKPENLYPQHHEVLRQFTAQHAIPVVHGLPLVDSTTFARYQKSRIVVKDQWASHPSTADRESHLRSLNIHTEVEATPAWALFQNADALQAQMTDKVYAQDTKATLKLDRDAFAGRLQTHVDKYKLDALYKDYFDGRNISETDVRNLEQHKPEDISLDQILSDETLALPYQIVGLRQDIATLTAIMEGEIPVKQFDFDGRKYSRKDADHLKTELERELAASASLLEETDKRVIALFLRRAVATGKTEELRRLYSNLFIVSKASEEDIKLYQNIVRDLLPIYHLRLESSQVNQIMEKTKIHEYSLKERLTILISDVPHLFTPAETKAVSEYLPKQNVYFFQDTFNNEALSQLNEVLGIFYHVASDRSFLARKEILAMQAAFYQPVVRVG